MVKGRFKRRGGLSVRDCAYGQDDPVGWFK